MVAHLWSANVKTRVNPRGNPLDRYRQAQRRARGLFEPFTSANCPTCPTPCCRKPTRVRPIDVVLAQELGYQLPMLPGCVTPSTALLEALTTDETAEAGAPCDFLRANGCSFPSDLRPFGCAALICDPMRRALNAAEIAPVERAVAELELAHRDLMEFLHADPLAS